jgi:type-F conjugative transfer system protein TrbI
MKPLIKILSALSLLSAVGILSGWMSSSPKVVSVDITHIKGQFIAQLAHKAATPEQVNHASIRFNRMLKRALELYATRAHVVILDRQFILWGAEDATDEITRVLSDAMGSTS